MIERRRLKDQQRANHLCPRRATLRGRRDDDVVGAQGDRVPPRAVGHHPLVVHPVPAHRAATLATVRSPCEETLDLDVA